MGPIRNLAWSARAKERPLPACSNSVRRSISGEENRAAFRPPPFVSLPASNRPGIKPVSTFQSSAAAFSSEYRIPDFGSAVPMLRKKVERPRWKLAMAIEFVNQILELDKKAPRKQRYTARSGAHPEGDAGVPNLRSNRPAVCSRLEDCDGPDRSRYLRYAKLLVGRGSAGGLVGSLCGSCRRAHQPAGVFDAQHGHRRGIPLRFSPRQGFWKRRWPLTSRVSFESWFTIP